MSYLITNEVLNCKLPQCNFTFLPGSLLPAKSINYILLYVQQLCHSLVTHLADPSQGAVGSIWALLVRQPPAAKAVHGVGGDGVAELLEGVVPVPALFDLMK